VEKTRDASDRFLPPKRTCVHPHLACSRLALAAFAAGTPHGVLGSVRYDRGTRRFTAPATASADRHRARVSSPLALRPVAMSVGVFFPRRRCDRTSDTPVAISGSPSRLTRLRGCCHLAGRPSFERFRPGRRVPRPPRPPSAPARESLRFVMIRDAFRQQGPFVGSGGHYSPGPATSPPLLAM